MRVLGEYTHCTHCRTRINTHIDLLLLLLQVVQPLCDDGLELKIPVIRGKLVSQQYSTANSSSVNVEKCLEYANGVLSHILKHNLLGDELPRLFRIDITWTQGCAYLQEVEIVGALAHATVRPFTLTHYAICRGGV
jgi:hypothetical protein